MAPTSPGAQNSKSRVGFGTYLGPVNKCYSCVGGLTGWLRPGTAFRVKFPHPEQNGDGFLPFPVKGLLSHEVSFQIKPRQCGLGKHLGKHRDENAVYVRSLKLQWEQHMERWANDL